LTQHRRKAGLLLLWRQDDGGGSEVRFQQESEYIPEKEETSSQLRSISFAPTTDKEDRVT